MRHSRTVLALGIMLISSAAHSHVRVRPVESQAGARETYTISVPTEGSVATSSVELEVPATVSVISVAGPAQTKKAGDRIISIRWTTKISPGESREFVFEALNPAAGQDITWKAHQRFEDGSSADWVDAPKSKRPASVTKLRGP
jgi:uncharacterized protein YcnI